MEKPSKHTFWDFMREAAGRVRLFEKYISDLGFTLETSETYLLPFVLFHENWLSGGSGVRWREDHDTLDETIQPLPEVKFLHSGQA